MKPHLMEWRLTRVCAMHARVLGERAFAEGRSIRDVPRFGDEVLQGYLASYWMRGWLLKQSDTIESAEGRPQLRVLVDHYEGPES